MVLAVFNSKCVIFTNHMPRGTTGTTMKASYIVEALGKFLKVLKQKRPDMAAGTGGFTGIMLTDWIAARCFQVIQHLPCLPDLTPADFFLVPKVKRELAGLTLP